MHTRRDFLAGTAAVAAAGIANPVAAFAHSEKKEKMRNQPPDAAIGHNGMTYKVDKGWAKIGVSAFPLSNCHEMVQDSKGRLIMLGDHTANNILIFDKSGKLLDYWGSAFPGGHGLTLAKEGGEDFLLITDCGYFQDRYGQSQAQSGQVLKTTTEGKVIFSLGHPRTIGVYKDDEKFQPTETAVAPNGDIYVADGYGSDYILQYNNKGQFIRQFGGHHNADKEHDLHNAHGVTVDNRDPQNPQLVCSSREENCFKVFTLDGKFKKRIDMPGMFVCRAVINGDHLYSGVCWSKDASGKQFDRSGFVTILDKNDKVVSNPGGEAPVYKNGKLQPVLQAPDAIFAHGHDVCVDDEQNVYVCQWNASYTPPVKLTRVS